MFTLGSALAAGPCMTGAFCQQHVAIGASNTLTISWVSTGASASLQWGVSSALPLPQTASASTETYTLHDLCEPNLVALRGWEEPGSQHHATIDYGDATELWYRVGDGTTWGNVTGPVRIPSRLTSFAVFGDMGTYEYAPKSNALGAVDAHVAAALERAAPTLDAVVHVGDLAYAHDGPASRWRYWMEEIETGGVDGQLASVVPWMVGCGNHDCLYDNPHKPPWAGSILSAGEDGGQCGVPYNARFKMPGDPTQIDGWHESRNGTRNNLFYSFDVGSVHFVMLSSEHDLGDGSAQLAWLAADLAAVDRSRRTPFVLVGLHRPVYTSTKLGIKLPETKGQQAALEPLLLQHRVSAVFAGHYHQYERSCPIARNACAVNGTVHVTAGIAGLQHHDDFASPAPSWAKVQVTDTFGYTRVTVVNATHMKVQAIDYVDDSAFDEFWLEAP